MTTLLFAEGRWHVDELVRRIALGAGQLRPSAATWEAIHRACRLAIAKGDVAQDGDYLYSCELEPRDLRVYDRSALPSP